MYNHWYTSGCTDMTGYENKVRDGRADAGSIRIVVNAKRLGYIQWVKSVRAI